jgi:hypothetical protein
MMAKKPNPHARALGKLGGLARTKKLTSAQRSEIARKAGIARWENLNAKERSRIAALGGKASKGTPKDKRRRET